MSETTSTPPGDTAGGPAGGPGAGRMAPVDLRDLDARGVLDRVASARANADREEAALLAAVVAYVDLHPVTDPDTDPGTDPGSEGPVGWPTTRPLIDRGVAVETPLAGAGTPGVASYAVEALAAALHLPYRSTLGLVADAVELCYRLPRLWALVHDGRLQAWKARQVAHETTHLSRPTVAFVDRHLAVPAARNQLPNVAGLIHEALLRCDPQAAAAREQAALDRRDVAFEHRESTATSTLTATLDTLDALDLDATVSTLAAEMATLGDISPTGVRRSHALGLLANPQRTLTLFGNPVPDPARRPPPRRGRRRAAPEPGADTGPDPGPDAGTGVRPRAGADTGPDQRPGAGPRAPRWSGGLGPGRRGRRRSRLRWCLRERARRERCQLDRCRRGRAGRGRAGRDGCRVLWGPGERRVRGPLPAPQPRRPPHRGRWRSGWWSG